MKLITLAVILIAARPAYAQTEKDIVADVVKTLKATMPLTLRLANTELAEARKNLTIAKGARIDATASDEKLRSAKGALYRTDRAKDAAIKDLTDKQQGMADEIQRWQKKEDLPIPWISDRPQVGDFGKFEKQVAVQQKISPTEAHLTHRSRTIILKGIDTNTLPNSNSPSGSFCKIDVPLFFVREETLPEGGKVSSKAIVAIPLNWKAVVSAYYNR